MADGPPPLRSPSLSATSPPDLRPTPQRTHSQTMRLAHSSSPSHGGHRHSFTDQLRGMPPSPRANRMERNQSLSHAQIQDLIDNPPTKGDGADPKFAGRDWQHISVGELCEEGDLRWVELDTGVEDATNVGQPCGPHENDHSADGIAASHGSWSAGAACEGEQE